MKYSIDVNCICGQRVESYSWLCAWMQRKMDIPEKCDIIYQCWNINDDVTSHDQHYSQYECRHLEYVSVQFFYIRSELFKAPLIVLYDYLNLIDIFQKLYLLLSYSIFCKRRTLLWYRLHLSNNYCNIFIVVPVVNLSIWDHLAINFSLWSQQPLILPWLPRFPWVSKSPT